MESMDELLHHCVKNLDVFKLRELLPDYCGKNSTVPCDAYLVLVETIKDREDVCDVAVQIVYTLRNYGVDINFPDRMGFTALTCYLKAAIIHPDVVEAMLRCNADIYQMNEMRESPAQLVMNEAMPKLVKDLFVKYAPGIWKSVEDDDVLNVRTLINQWCRVDLTKQGKTLLQLSLEKGTENVIRIVKDIGPSMELAHSVMAGDKQRVINTLQSKKKFIIDFKNMGSGGATPLFYAIWSNNLELVDMLLSHGSKFNVSMNMGQELDIPMVFAFFQMKDVLQTNILQRLLSEKIDIDNCYYKGRNVLFHCIDHNAPSGHVEALLRKGSAALVTARIKANVDPRAYAASHGREDIVAVIDKTVATWCSDDNYGDNRKLLALHGYEGILCLDKDHEPHSMNKKNFNSPIDEFFNNLNNYWDLGHPISDWLNFPKDYYQGTENHVDAFMLAIEVCDIEGISALLHYPDNEARRYYELCIANCRRKGCGQSPLHKAVLRKQVNVVEMLAETLVYQAGQKLDIIRDQYFRTPLHYAYGMTEGKAMVDTLLNYGASEFTMDKDGRSPLAFRDRMGHQLMEGLLKYQLLQNFKEPEPDPFSVRLPLPITGYIMKCVHENHKHLIGRVSRKLASLHQPGFEKESLKTGPDMQSIQARTDGPGEIIPQKPDMDSTNCEDENTINKKAAFISRSDSFEYSDFEDGYESEDEGTTSSSSDLSASPSCSIL